MNSRVVSISAIAARNLCIVLCALVVGACGESKGASAVPPVTKPAPVEPTPTKPTPTEPAPTEPTPTERTPTEPTPTEPAPTEPTSPLEIQGWGEERWELIWFGLADGEKQRVEIGTSYSFGIMTSGSLYARYRCNYLHDYFWSATFDADFIHVVNGGYVTAVACFFQSEPMISIAQKQDGLFKSIFWRNDSEMTPPIAYEIEGDYLTLTNLEENQSLIFRPTTFNPTSETCSNRAPVDELLDSYSESYHVHFSPDVDVADMINHWAEHYPDLEVVGISDQEALAILISSDQTFQRLRCAEGVESMITSERGIGPITDLEGL